jgi:putative aldouronate transport system substrate-binding protein
MTAHQTITRRQLLRTTSGAAAGLALGAPSLRANAAVSAAPTRQSRPKVVIWAPGDNGTVADWNEDPILAAVKDATNTDIEISKTGWDSYLDQVNAAVAGGEVPDVIGTIDHSNRTLMAQWVRDGVVAAFDGDVGAAAPNILAQYEKNPTLNELKIDDKIYMKPVSWGDGNYPNMGLIHVRKDLLDTYKLPPPDTFEQYFAFLRAAKKDGATGVIFGAGGAAGVGPGGGIGPAINAFAGAYGLPFLGWVKTPDGYQYASIQPKMRDALLLFRKMVSEDLVDPSSWELQPNDARDRYVAGTGCSLIFNGGGHIGRIQNDMDLSKRGYQEYLLPALDAGAGSRGYLAEPQFYGGTFVANLKGNDPVVAARVLDFLSGEEGIKLTALGVPGRDYKEANGEITLLPQRTKDGFPTEGGTTGAHPLASAIVSWVPQKWQDFALLYGKPAAFKDWYAKMWANQGQHQVQGAGLLTTSPLWNDFQSSSTELVTRTFLEIARAGSDADVTKMFDAFVDEWKKSGGADATTEMSQVLTAIYG